MALAVLAWGSAQGQSIVSFHVPTDLCAGSTATISFGIQSDHNVVVHNRIASLSRSERTFLPDGVQCNGSCSYVSEVTFTDFPETSVIRNVQDIKFVRINMEHSYIGDIYIGITCPNGSRASLMNYSNAGTSQCSQSIPASHKGWKSGSNVSKQTYLGDPVDSESSSNKCDSSLYGNRAGVGWNYCWSNNTTNGYTYGAGDGIIYRSGNEVYLNSSSWMYSGSTIDSSNVAQGRNFYHPDNNFNVLVGCPVNGDWSIEVMDGYSVDNGYIFEWELALNEQLVSSTNCLVTGYNIIGDGVTMLNDSLFTITAPTGITADTAVLYTFRILNACNDYIDTTAWITFHPTYNQIVRDTVDEADMPHNFRGHVISNEVADSLFAETSAAGCDSLTHYSLQLHTTWTDVTDTAICADALPFSWHGRSYLRSVTDTFKIVHPESMDSVYLLHLTVHPLGDTTVRWDRVENDLPVYFNGETFSGIADSTFHLTDRHGCDSAVHFNLNVHYNHSYEFSKSVCADELPLNWLGHTFTGPSTLMLTESDAYGADSTLKITLIVHPIYDTLLSAAICDNQGYPINGQLLDTAGSYTFHHRTVKGCDSTVRVELAVNPTNVDFTEDTVCASSCPYLFGEESFYHSGTHTSTFTNRYGCDSTITLNLTVLGEALKAEIRAIPMVVTPDDNEVRLYDASSGNNDRRWDIDGNVNDLRNQTFTYPIDQDSVPLMLIVSSHDGCHDTAYAVLRIDRSALAIPNVFTPTQATNNTWQPEMRDIEWMEIWIYNRDGQLVRHFEGLDMHWDGTTEDGTACRQASYVYTMRYRTTAKPEQTVMQTGSILLIR